MSLGVGDPHARWLRRGAAVQLAAAFAKRLEANVA